MSLEKVEHRQTQEKKAMKYASRADDFVLPSADLAHLRGSEPIVEWLCDGLSLFITNEASKALEVGMDEPHL